MDTSRFLRSLATALTLVLVLLVSSLTAPRAHADTISISPPRFELFGNPGDTVNEKLKVTNNGGAEVTYEASVEDFQPAGDNGEIALIDDPNAPKTNFSLAKWLTVEPSRFTVPAGQQRLVNLSIRIPKDGEPGGHYASILVKLAGQPAVGGGASVESHLNSLILLRVAGNIDEKLELESFKTDQNYFQYGPIDFTLRTKNDGNVHVAPTGTIVITDTFNHKVAEVPLRQGNVLPGSSRSLKTTWETKNLIGRYTATLVSTYGQNKQPMTSTTTFVVFPLSLLWILLGIILVILLLVTQRRHVKRIIHNLTSD